jgi:hypothetical protein
MSGLFLLFTWRRLAPFRVGTNSVAVKSAPEIFFRARRVEVAGTRVFGCSERKDLPAYHAR